jgi:hypothetical protein
MLNPATFQGDPGAGGWSESTTAVGVVAVGEDPVDVGAPFQKLGHDGLAGGRQRPQDQ